MLLLADGAPFGVFGLKRGSEGWRIRRRFPIPAGAAHWAAHNSQAVADSRLFPIRRKLVKTHGARLPGFAPVPLARQTQAQFWNRTSGKFPPAQGPSGPGWKRWQALLALRAGNFAELLRSGPRKWGPGKGDYEHVSAHRSRPRGRFGYFAATGKVTRRPGPGSLEKKPIFGGEIGAIPKGGGRGTPQGGFISA